MAQNYTWPSSSDVTVTGIGTPNNQPIPSTSVLVAGENPSGNQQVFQTTSDGSLLVSSDPTSTGNVNLTEVSGSAITLGQKASIASLPVVIASDQSTLPVSAASLPLPTGAATSANQSTEITALQAIEANQTNGTQVTNITGTVPLPTGAATSANQSTEIASLAAINTNTGDVANTTDAVGGSVPSDALMIGASKAGILEPLALDVSGYLEVNVETSALPTGAATSANQSTEISSLSTIASNQTNGTQQSQIVNAAAQAITQAALTIGTSAVRLTVSGSAPSATIGTRTITPDSASAAKFYLGGSSVTVGTGAQIVAGQVIILNNDACDYFLISDTTAQTVYITQEGS